MNNKKLTVVCGRAGTGKTNYCINEIIKRLQEDEDKTQKLILLVPEQFTVQAEKILLKQLEGGSIIRADVVNFKRMAHRALEYMHGGQENVKVIDIPGRKMILYKAVEECKSELIFYKGALDHSGMIDELLELISETGRYKFTKDKMKEVIDKLPEGLPLVQKLSELSLIIEKYEEILHRKYVDGKDLLDILAEQIQNSEIYDGAHIWIDGFFGFTAQEYSIIRELLYKASKVTVTLCCGDPDDRLHEYVDFLHSVYKTQDSLKKIARDNNIEYGIVKLKTNSRHANNEMLKHFEKEYDNYPAQAFEGTSQAISVYAAKDIYSEVEYAACKIIELCRDKGFRYKDIAIIAKNIENYLYVCKDVFEQTGIPFFIDTKKDVLKHPLAKLIMSALDIITENFSYRSVFAYLKTGLLNLDQNIIDIIENHVLSKNISSLKKWTDDERWIFTAAGDEQNICINNERNAILKPLLTLKENLGKSKNITRQAESLYNFLIDINITEVIENKDEEYIKIWNAVINVLDKMVEALGYENVTMLKFTNIFKAGLENYQIGEIPAGLDRVQIGNLERTINTDIKALFFMEINEGVIPGGARKEGLITDSERQLLSGYNINLAADSHEQAYLEEFQIYAGLMSPSEYLFLSYIVKDSSGKAKRPSRVIGRIMKMFPNINVSDDVLKNEIFMRPLDCLPSEEFAFSKYLYYLGSHRSNGGEDNVWKETGQYLLKYEKYKSRIEKAREYKYSLSANTRISKMSAEVLFGTNIVTSVSRIEKYNSCPYLFFMEYGIKVKEREIPDFSSREAGTFVHEILERIGADVESVDIDTVVNEVLARNSSLALKDSKRYYFLARKTGEMVKRTMEIISHQMKSGEFRLSEFEAQCNMQIELGEGKLARLTGKIDRIDTYCDGHDTYYRIIDYKTGNKTFNEEDFNNGTSLQLMMYLDSVIKQNKNAYPAGAFYLNVKDRFLKMDTDKDMTIERIESETRKKYKFNGILLADVDIARAMDKNIGTSSEIIQAGVNKDGTLSKRSRTATKEEFAEFFKKAEKIAGNTVNGYTSGEIAPRPVRKFGGKCACDYCKYDTICGKEEKK